MTDVLALEVVGRRPRNVPTAPVPPAPPPERAEQSWQPRRRPRGTLLPTRGSRVTR